LLVEGEEDVFWWERDGDIILTIHFNMDNVKTTTGQPWYYM